MFGSRGDDNRTNEADTLKQIPLTSEQLKNLFSSSADIVFRDVQIKSRVSLNVVLVYVDGLVNLKIIDDNILGPLMSGSLVECTGSSDSLKVSLNAVQISSVAQTQDTNFAVAEMMAGKTLLVFDKLKSALILNTIGFEKRSITPSIEENTFRSDKNSFIETLRVNTSMLRRKIKSSSLVIEETTAGRQSNTRICLAYMRNICNDNFIEKIRKSIANINQDEILSIQDIYKCIIKHKYSPFPSAVITERVGVCAKSLLEGKIAVIVDELPYALVLPAVVGDFFQTSSDSSENFLFASLFRLLRYACFLIAITLPGFYISIVTFHPEMLPYKLAIAIEASRTGVPFSVLTEALGMALAFFTLIQASLLISQSVGSAISIVGGLVLGQAAITANLISPAVIVVVATSSICSLAVPNKDAYMASWIFQVICIVLSGIFGILAVVVVLLTVLFIMARQHVLGVPYLSPYAGDAEVQLDDSFIKFPQNLIKMRPSFLRPKNQRRKP